MQVPIRGTIIGCRSLEALDAFAHGVLPNTGPPVPSYHMDITNDVHTSEPGTSTLVPTCPIQVSYLFPSFQVQVGT